MITAFLYIASATLLMQPKKTMVKPQAGSEEASFRRCLKQRDKDGRIINTAEACSLKYYGAYFSGNPRTPFEIGSEWATSTGDHPVPPTGDQVGHVDRLSTAEYDRLQKLRQAVTDAETDIAKAHGVTWVPLGSCKMPSPPSSGAVMAICLSPDLVPRARYEFRGQFLLINVPEAK